MDKYEVVIIGAGPAGTSAGIILRQAGIRCCIIEKSYFPREKTCGGLLTHKTLSELQALNLGAPPDFLIKNRVTRVEICNHNVPSMTLQCKIPFALTERRLLDNWLFEQYISLGGDVIKQRALSIDTLGRQVRLSNGENVPFKYVIGADGMAGISANHVKRGNVSRAFGLEVDLPLNEINCPASEIMLDVGLFRNGYAWRFPKGDYANIGFAFTYEKGFNYLSFFKTYLNETYGFTGSFSPRGAFLPYGAGSSTAVNAESQLFLTGDAAGFVDAITGEGLYYAVHSGRIAAQAILRELEDPSYSAIQAYHLHAKNIFASIKKSWNLISLFYKLRPIVLTLGRGHPRIVSFFCDTQVSQNIYNYNLYKLLSGYRESKEMDVGAEK